MQHSKYRSFLRRVLGVLSFAIFSAMLGAAPAYFMVTLPAGAEEPAKFKQQLAESAKAGAKVLRFDNIQNDNPGFASLTILRFKDEDSAKKWSKSVGAKLKAPLVVKRADLLTDAKYYPKGTPASLFKVNHYKLTDTHESYAKFVAGYIVPLMEGQRVTGLMSGYAMFAEREPVGKANSILVALYRDNASFVEAAPVKRDVRAKLTESHPTYPGYHQTKGGLRTNLAETIAGWVEVR